MTTANISPSLLPCRYSQPQNGCASVSASSQNVTVWPIELESFHPASIISIVKALSCMSTFAMLTWKRVPTWPARFCWNCLNG